MPTSCAAPWCWDVVLPRMQWGGTTCNIHAACRSWSRRLLPSHNDTMQAWSYQMVI